MTQANDIVIVSGVRTAIGTFNGSLKHTHQHDLGAAVIREAIARAGIAPQDIDETIVGNVGQIAESGFIARICQLRAGIPQESTAYSVNRQCGLTSGPGGRHDAAAKRPGRGGRRLRH